MRNEFRSSHEQGLGSTVVVLACAACAGAHAGLVPAHLNGEPRLGWAFVLAVVLLVSAALAISARPGDRRILAAAGLLLGGLMLAYIVSRTTGIPVLDPEPETVDAVGVATTAVEAIGLVCALWMAQPAVRHRRSTHVQEVSR